MSAMHESISGYWSKSAAEMLAVMGSRPEGLNSEEVRQRLDLFGKNVFVEQQRRKTLRLFLDRFRNPLIWILVFAAVIALIAKEWVDALVVLAIVFISAILSFVQEYQASNAVEKLRQRVSARATILRANQTVVVPFEEIVPGDIIQLSAGSLIPADGIVLEAKDCYVSQAMLTGETFPVEKQPGLVAENASLSERNNCVFMGTSVRSGTATVLIVQTANQTIYGQITARLAQRAPETELERGLRRFGNLLLRVMLTVVIVVLAVNMLLNRPPIDTLLFAVSLAVGLSPELLPAILAITLAHGAQEMAKRGVIVRRLNAIENLGSMDVLCTDKTGTLTEGVIQLDSALDPGEQPSEMVLHLAYVNSHFQAGMDNPLDTAVNAKAAAAGLKLKGVSKVDEIPYDFVRKRLSVIVSMPDSDRPLLIVKGAFTNGCCWRTQNQAAKRAKWD